MSKKSPHKNTLIIYNDNAINRQW